MHVVYNLILLEDLFPITVYHGLPFEPMIGFCRSKYTDIFKGKLTSTS